MYRMYDDLAQVPLLHMLPTDELKHLGEVCAVRRFRKGEMIFQENQPAEAVWIIQCGWVYLVKRTPHDGVATIFTMTPDEAICGVSAFDHGTYAAGAIAATDTQLITIPSEAFSELLERHPKFARQVLVSCCQRLRRMAEMISLAQAPVEQRVAYILLRLRTSFGATIPITHQELARMVGTRWETSIRALSAMRRRGWVTTSRGRVTILTPGKLRTFLRNGKASETQPRR